MRLSDEVEVIKGVGPGVAAKFAALGVRTVRDLIDYFPRRYDDYSQITSIAKLKPGTVTIQAEIKQAAGRYVRRGMHITEAVASDETGSVRLVWFNQPYRAAALKSGQPYFITGDFALRHQRLTIQNPSVELVSDFPVNTARIVPKYRETKGFTSAQIRKILRELIPQIDQLPETLPAWLVAQHQLISYAEAVHHVHFPDDTAQLDQARRRLGFEEVFRLALAALMNKHDVAHGAAPALAFDKRLAQQFVEHLPFKLTDDQRRVIWQVCLDIQKTQPMNRLVEGDVGSGKTVVAAMVGGIVISQGKQVALMAPTELLARQHAETIHRLMHPLGLEHQVGLLVGGMTPAQKRAVHQVIKAGDVRFIIGTHALIQDKVDMHELGLVIVDEQHRFGVDQRKALQAKTGHAVHVLNMTATPIPRSLALTLYGELDISVISTKPAGRKPIKTKAIPLSARHTQYEKLNDELTAGRQVFVVCPLVTDSEAVSARSAESVYEELSNKYFKHRRVGLLHGKMKPADKDAVMQQFATHELDVLVATTVIEVGVDVPNATVMVVENAERFGLAQVHQLRGRVGRSEHQGYCYLMLSDNQPPGPRLRALATSSDGFKLAEYDLELRGPGAIYGTLQHGALDLRVAKLTDVKLISQARTAAQAFLDNGENLLKYPEMAERVMALRAVTTLN
ncbi:ATP-dependent DNA helicase RecG [Patescibacteria group bacterium]|nr:MAG: ATP-dependent DNA helicase RecG [Patescibacteria group bacterium]